MPGKKYKYYITIVKGAKARKVYGRDAVWIRRICGIIKKSEYDHLSIVEIDALTYRFLIKFPWAEKNFDEISRGYRIIYD